MAKKYSIIIPTFNHLEDCLKPCCDGVFKNTNFNSDEIELIIVANGCTDGTKEYVEDLQTKFNKNIVLLEYPESMGYPKAVNAGLKVTTGDYIILLNNDAFILGWAANNNWINFLEEPFIKYSDCAVSGPMRCPCEDTGYHFIIFYCAMISRKAFLEIGYLDESFGLGGGEDMTFCIEAQKKGFQVYQVPLGINSVYKEGMMRGGFPLYHKGEATMHGIDGWHDNFVRNTNLLKERYKNDKKNHGVEFIVDMINKKMPVKLNLGAGPIEVSGYVSVDRCDKKATVIMDVLDLNLPDNSIDGILASHLFEHINPYHATAILANWCRMLKPGCQLIMEMPNIEALCKRFMVEDKGWRYGVLNCIYGSVNTHSNTVGDITSPHLFGWWPESITDHLQWAGFKDIKILPEQIPHPFPDCNMRVEATKPI